MDAFKVGETGEVKTFSLYSLRGMCDSLLSVSLRVWPATWLSLMLARNVTGLVCPCCMAFPASMGQMSSLLSVGWEADVRTLQLCFLVHRWGCGREKKWEQLSMCSVQLCCLASLFQHLLQEDKIEDALCDFLHLHFLPQTSIFFWKYEIKNATKVHIYNPSAQDAEAGLSWAHRKTGL